MPPTSRQGQAAPGKEFSKILQKSNDLSRPFYWTISIGSLKKWPIWINRRCWVKQIPNQSPEISQAKQAKKKKAFPIWPILLAVTYRFPELEHILFFFCCFFFRSLDEGKNWHDSQRAADSCPLELSSIHAPPPPPQIATWSRAGEHDVPDPSASILSTILLKF